ncbi:hypothetical protein GCM10010500_79150 [Streptomyces nigrescens]|nr:hypothetical protein GCM10010500_79150 [Streptomyces libani subsp. libani]
MPAEVVDQPVCLDGVAAGDDQGVGGADGENVGQEPAVECAEVHAAADIPPARAGKAASRTSRMRRLGARHGPLRDEQAPVEQRGQASGCPSARTVR